MKISSNILSNPYYFINKSRDFMGKPPFFFRQKRPCDGSQIVDRNAKTFIIGIDNSKTKET